MSLSTLMTLCMCKAIKCTRKIWKIFWLCIKPTQVIIDDLHLAWIKDTLFVNIFRLNLPLLKNKTYYDCWDRVYWYSEGVGGRGHPKKGNLIPIQVYKDWSEMSWQGFLCVLKSKNESTLIMDGPIHILNCNSSDKALAGFNYTRNKGLRPFLLYCD